MKWVGLLFGWFLFTIVFPYLVFAFCAWEIHPNDLFGDMNKVDRVFSMFLWLLWFFAVSALFARVAAEIEIEGQKWK